MRVLQCGYAESKRNVLRRVLNVLTDGAVWQLNACFIVYFTFYIIARQSLILTPLHVRLLYNNVLFKNK